MTSCAGWAIDGGPDRPTDGRTDRRRARKREPLQRAIDRAAGGDEDAIAEIASIEAANAAAIQARAWRKQIDPGIAQHLLIHPHSQLRCLLTSASISSAVSAITTSIVVIIADHMIDVAHMCCFVVLHNVQPSRK
jgi:hypothetical protein